MRIISRLSILFVLQSLLFPTAFAQNDLPFDDLDAELAPPKETPKKSAKAKESSIKARGESAASAASSKAAEKATEAKDPLEDELSSIDDAATSSNENAASTTTKAKESAEKATDKSLDDLEQAMGSLDKTADETADKLDQQKETAKKDEFKDLDEDPLAQKEETETKNPEQGNQELAKDIPLEDDTRITKEVKPPPPPPTVPKALQSDEVISTLDPSDLFYRIPLKPPMSDTNWRKFAGPQLEKIYKIRKGDTLWAISERLFGNPYLWPKVWQLNAQFGNPHIIDPGIQLQFFLGNPNSAPILAIRLKEGGTEYLPVLESFQKLSFLEELDGLIKAQLKSSDPPFKTFLVEDMPEEIAVIPKRRVGDPFFYSEGNDFTSEDLVDGDYSVVRGEALNSPGSPKVGFSGYRMHWLGTLTVNHHHAIITRSFAEMEPGDLIIQKDFSVKPLSLREEKLGPSEASRVKITPLEEGTFAVGTGGYRTMGLRFPSKTEGPTPGAILKFEFPEGELGTIVVVQREGRYATGWVYESKREVLPSDKLK